MEIANVKALAQLVAHVIDISFLGFNDAFAIVFELIMIQIGLDLAIQTWDKSAVMVIAEVFQKSTVK
ncbi:hypothetical protein Q8A64_18240 [Oxalobacteraceae bacterium R-40]|uniref:Uncharacterized protein n=1 Tax=Keguizhuia sedimenti TaxID=3064264 RepID=A0ABU1BTK3_9BURK|nr:hypothetical protein [Oxalobacteraceae bacterium R-40]